MKCLGRSVVLIVMFFLMAGSAYAEGLLRYAGATTLQRFFMPQIASVFSSDTAIRINIEGGNTGPGIRALLNGEVDMAGAGRLLTEAEKAQGILCYYQTDSSFTKSDRTNT